MFTVTSATASSVVATFSDGKPALLKTAVGAGSAFYAGFMPGLAYFSTAIPHRPVDRSSVDEGMNHFIPTEFAVAARDRVLWLPLAGREDDPTVVPVRAQDRASPNSTGLASLGLDIGIFCDCLYTYSVLQLNTILGLAFSGPAPSRPQVRASNPLVEVGQIRAANVGTALPCVNWAGAALPGFNVTLNSEDIKFKTATLSSGGKITVANRTLVFALPITADVIILR
jgi:hypothetical protein